MRNLFVFKKKYIIYFAIVFLFILLIFTILEVSNNNNTISKIDNKATQNSKGYYVVQITNYLADREKQKASLFAKYSYDAIEKNEIKKISFLIRKIRTLVFLEDDNFQAIIEVCKFIEKENVTIDMINKYLEERSSQLDKNYEPGNSYNEKKVYLVHLLEFLEECKIDLMLKKSLTNYEKERLNKISISIIDISHALRLAEIRQDEVLSISANIQYYKELAGW